jgi:hypothetical protein
MPEPAEPAFFIADLVAVAPHIRSQHVRTQFDPPPCRGYTPPGPEAAFARAAEHACADTRPAAPRERRSQGGGGDPGIGRNPSW